MFFTIKYFSRENITDFCDYAFEFLCCNEAQNCVILGIITTMQAQQDIYPEAHFWCVLDGGQVVGAAWVTPPGSLGLTSMPIEAVKQIYSAVKLIPINLHAVTGPRITADMFRDMWVGSHSGAVVKTMKQRIYELRGLVQKPLSVSGDIRLADENDQLLLEKWSGKFIRDSGLLGAEHPREYALRAIKAKSRYLWVVENEAVSMAGASGRTPSGIRISWVYTPLAYRGNGYATALVAELSNKMIAGGRKSCFLYADAANQGANRIYQKIGYRHIGDSVRHCF